MYNNLKQRIVPHCKDVIKPFTVCKKNDDDYWHKMNDLKFKAHLEISKCIYEYYYNVDWVWQEMKIVKFIHDDIQFITSDLYKSIDYKFENNITNKKIEEYANKLANVIISYVEHRQLFYLNYKHHIGDISHYHFYDRAVANKITQDGCALIKKYLRMQKLNEIL